MPQYRHREKGYIVKATNQVTPESRTYFIENYHEAAGMRNVGVGGIFLLREDFEKLFEPVEELKSCPYCGSDFHVTAHRAKRSSRDYGGKVYIQCNNCGLRGPSVMEQPDSKGRETQAIRIWNRMCMKKEEEK